MREVVDTRPSSTQRTVAWNLSGMTLLFYTAPAGMVLYWTSTNAVQLVIQELRRLHQRAGVE